MLEAGTPRRPMVQRDDPGRVAGVAAAETFAAGVALASAENVNDPSASVTVVEAAGVSLASATGVEEMAAA